MPGVGKGAIFVTQEQSQHSDENHSFHGRQVSSKWEQHSQLRNFELFRCQLGIGMSIDMIMYYVFNPPLCSVGCHYFYNRFVRLFIAQIQLFPCQSIGMGFNE